MATITMPRALATLALITLTVAACGGSNQTSGSRALHRHAGRCWTRNASTCSPRSMRSPRSARRVSLGSTVVSVQGTGHIIQLDQPGLVIDEVADLLEGTP